MASTFRADTGGIGRMLRGEESMAGLREDLLTRAKRVRDLCEATASVGDPIEGDDTPGTWKASFHADTEIRTDAFPQRGGGIGRRVVAVVYSTDPHGASKEVGHEAARGRGMHGPGRFIEGDHTMARAIGAAK